jgi:CubicO group peptidase (beta-lactamase class C family)
MKNQYFKQILIRTYSLMLAAVLLLAPFSASRTPAQSSKGKWIHVGSADTLIEQYLKKNDVPGMSVGIVKNGEIIYAKGFGWKNIEKKIRASELTRYRLASVSKAVTAVLTMELVEKGTLNLSKKIREYMPELPSHHTYTVRELLCHQSGVRHYKDGDDPTKSVDEHYTSAKKALDLFIKDKLVMTPGSDYKYTTHGFSVLAALIEKRTNKLFRQYAHERFYAWGLKDLNAENSPTQGVNRSEIYKREDGRNKVSRRDDVSWKYAGGGYESSVLDLCRLGIKLLNNQIISKASRDSMWTAQSSDAGKTGYGFGWGVGGQNGRKIVAHSGEQNGAASYWRIYPNDGVVIVVLSNRRDHEPSDLGAALGNLVLTGTSSSPKPINP